MATVQITLPDELEGRAREAGLLSNEAMRDLLEGAVRRQAGEAFLALAREVQAENIPPMSMDEIVAEVRAVRVEQRTREAAARS